MSGRNRFIIFALFLTLSNGCVFRRSTFADRVSTPDWPDFTKSVKDYVTAVDLLEKDLPPLGDRATAAQVVTHQQALAKSIRASRKDARPGNIFTPEIRKRFVKIVRSEAKGRSGQPARQVIRDDNPNTPVNKPVTLAVNGVYPDAPPLSTMPPTMLLRLPVLPKSIEYRFVGKALVLRDVRANTIVDWIPNTLP